MDGISFEPVTPENLHAYRRFEDLFSAELSKFQSRIYPRESPAKLCWDYIKLNGDTLGAVWLEKAREEDRFAVLGIFISESGLRGRGIGRRAICRYISANARSMGVDSVRLNVRKENARAVRCYLSCGFSVTGEFVTQNGFPALQMEKTLRTEVEECS